MQLQEIGLSLRARNALQRAGVGTVEALCDLGTSDLAHMHGLGAGYIQEIPLALKRHGLALRDGVARRNGQTPPGRAGYGRVHSNKVVQRLGRFALCGDRRAFPGPADVDALRTAAALAGATGTPLGDRLRDIADRLAAMIPADTDGSASPLPDTAESANASRDNAR
jgi:hypothetical protein